MIYVPTVLAVACILISIFISRRVWLVGTVFSIVSGALAALLGGAIGLVVPGSIAVMVGGVLLSPLVEEAGRVVAVRQLRHTTMQRTNSVLSFGLSWSSTELIWKSVNRAIIVENDSVRFNPMALRWPWSLDAWIGAVNVLPSVAFHCLAASFAIRLISERKKTLGTLGTLVAMHVAYNLTVFASFALFGRQGITGLAWVLAVTAVIALVVVYHEARATKQAS